MSIPRCAKQVRMRLVDGTIVKEPGKTGSQWRFHYSLQIPKLICDSFKLLPANGEGVGESFEPTFRTPLVEVAYFTACLAN